MLEVLTPEEVLELIKRQFRPMEDCREYAGLNEAIGRVLAEDISADEYVPDFNRSTVDGYALRARDTFGCSDAVPAILPVVGQVLMGSEYGDCLGKDECVYVPTGGAVPEGADSVVMIEYTDDYGDGTVGILKSAAPGMNIIFKGDDVFPGKALYRAGYRLSAKDIGALAAIGRTEVPVVRKAVIGIISTGDELVPPENKPGPGQVRDVNSPMLAALLSGYGAEAVNYGIVVDDPELLREKIRKASDECDAVLISGGSSVGVKDAACRIIGELGEVLMHGIAIKPGKPTIMGKIGNKPIVGLPGHPVAAFFVSRLFVLPLIARLEGRDIPVYFTEAELSESMNSNNGRAQVCPCSLKEENGKLIADPIRTKAGLITQLSKADGYFVIDRDCEGLPKGSAVKVTVMNGD